MFYRKNGKPYPCNNEGTEEYVRDQRNNLIKQDRIKENNVKTVWTGKDEVNAMGPPKIFRTDVTSENGTLIKSEFYSTEDEAISGHKKICDGYKSPES